MKKIFTIVAMFILFTGINCAAELPLDFEGASEDYQFTNFDGGEVTIIDNNQSSGINTSDQVAQMVKKSGQTWGGQLYYP